VDAWGFGWKVITTRFTTVALPIAVAVVVQAILGSIVSVIGSTATTVLAEQGVVDATALGVLSFAVSGVNTVVSLLVNAFMAGGLMATALKAARGQPTSFGDPFSGGRYFGRMLVAVIVAFIVVTIGMLLCFVPGIIVALGIVFYGALIVDQDMAGIDALKKSWEMTKGHKLNIFLFGLIGIAVTIAGTLACLIGVLLVSVPMGYVAMASIYLRIKGENLPVPS